MNQRPRLQHFPTFFLFLRRVLYIPHIRRLWQRCVLTQMMANERFLMRVVLPDLTVIYSTTLIMGRAQQGCYWIQTQGF